MNKYVISLLLLLVTATAFCQKKSKVNLISSSKSEGVKRNGVDMIKVYNGVWKQDFSIMRSDSAYFHPAANSFEAFGHVNINQGDTLNIYSDKLNYDGNTKIAILTDNVVMVDKDATLTTNHFNYNTATRIGTYTEGGKLVNKTNTLVSKNGYYFSFSHDAYFRYNVVGTTNDAMIYTDTMRYNSQSKINYFYGPTRIYGTKDKDTLLTENGTYDTKTEQANFIKKNLYKQGTKSLVGDTLFYDRLLGFGRAVKHVTFNDNEQKITIKGGLGTYFKKNDLAIVTRDPYVIMVTEDTKDSTKTESVKRPLISKSKQDSLNKIAAGKVKKGDIINNKQVQQGIASLQGAKIPSQAKIDSLSGKLRMPMLDSINKKSPSKARLDSAQKMLTAQSKNIDKNTQNKLKTAGKGLLADTAKLKLTPPKDTSKIKRDSVYMSADTIETRILTYKELGVMQEQERLAHIKDTSAVKVVHIVYKIAPKTLTITAPRLPRDTSYLHPNYFGPPKPKAQKKKPVVAAAPKKNVKVDSTFLNRNIVLSDTARIRIIMAFHSAKIFKSDLQAIADSIFYSNSDSTIRCYTKPMIWTEGSQLSGDTIYLRMRNKKLYNMDMFPNAFIVNVEKGDSVNFNQVGGKRLRGFFKDSKLSRVYVDGNAESIYFVRDSATNKITDMQRSFSSRIRVFLKNNEVSNMGFLSKPENRYIPIHAVKEDEKILKGFLWKPKDRPVSKESIIPSYNRKHNAIANSKPIAAGPPGSKKPSGGKAGTVKIAGVNKTNDVKAGQDSTLNKQLKNLPLTKADSLLKNKRATGKDTSHAVPPPISAPPVKAKKDSIGK